MAGRWIFALLLVCLWNPARAQTKVESPPGELLYSTHCIACHTEKIHWRDKKVAKDWRGLKTQVRHWQGVAGLAWSDGEIVDVARYLNARHYHYPEPVQ